MPVSGVSQRVRREPVPVVCPIFESAALPRHRPIQAATALGRPHRQAHALRGAAAPAGEERLPQPLHRPWDTQAAPTAKVLMHEVPVRLPRQAGYGAGAHNEEGAAERTGSVNPVRAHDGRAQRLEAGQLEVGTTARAVRQPCLSARNDRPKVDTRTKPRMLEVVWTQETRTVTEGSLREAHAAHAAAGVAHCIVVVDDPHISMESDSRPTLLVDALSTTCTGI
eukprot:CAMPEP_0202799870 /NCGR_PEP_ID=MMETSP1388-20130828/99314_1 /ASSEMBLY_ACC=CAM_ASM_000864 /TAXON_ID=37098 /ORGANISM="Isochrysis sp, Strain CCMP1244" /LENGTH=223 /DNA_ID=CAMNT_0049469835 /DNA_START=170 /DNA_END=838 /DNA_ORIENTATION=+